MTGLENDGLVQRLQLFVYPDEKKKWELVDEKPDRDARERAYQIIEKLATFDPTDIWATQYDYDRFPSLRFSPEGQEIFNEWLTDLETKKLRSDDHPIILEHLGKYRSLMPTLALIFHIIELMDGGGGEAVSAPAATKAAAWCEYLESHARRIYGLVSGVGQQSAALLGEKIKQGKLQDGFTARDVMRKNWHLLNSRELAQTACDELVDARWLKAETTAPGFQQKGKVEYTINPKIKQQTPKNNTDSVDTL